MRAAPNLAFNISLGLKPPPDGLGGSFFGAGLLALPPVDPAAVFLNTKIMTMHVNSMIQCLSTCKLTCSSNRWRWRRRRRRTTTLKIYNLYILNLGGFNMTNIAIDIRAHLSRIHTTERFHIEFMPHQACPHYHIAVFMWI